MDTLNHAPLFATRTVPPTTEQLLNALYQLWLANCDSERACTYMKTTPPALYLWSMNTLSLRLPRCSGVTMTALELAYCRGRYIYVGSHVKWAKGTKSRLPIHKRQHSLFTSNRVVSENVRGLVGIKTVIFDCINMPVKEWHKRLAVLAECCASEPESYRDLLILRVGVET